MSVPEICVQIKNVPGQLVRVTTILADSGLSILGMTALATGKVGWVRIIVDNSKFALEALDDYGFTVELGEAVAVQLGDEAGSIDRALRILSDEKINVDYIYNIWERDTPEAVTVLGVQSPSKVEKLLKAEGFEVVDIKA